MQTKGLKILQFEILKLIYQPVNRVIRVGFDIFQARPE